MVIKYLGEVIKSYLLLCKVMISKTDNYVVNLNIYSCLSNNSESNLNIYSCLSNNSESLSLSLNLTK